MWKGAGEHVDTRNKPHTIYLKTEISSSCAFLLKKLLGYLFLVISENIILFTIVFLGKQAKLKLESYLAPF